MRWLSLSFRVELPTGAIPMARWQALAVGLKSPDSERVPLGAETESIEITALPPKDATEIRDLAIEIHPVAARSRGGLSAFIGKGS